MAGLLIPERVQRPPEPVTHLEFVLPELPPSDNELYFVKHGKKILSDTGKKFKNGIKENLRKVWEEAGMPLITREMMLDITILCRFAKIFTRSKEAENAFMPKDAQNRGKVLCDAIAEHFGLPDSQNFWVHLGKCEGEPEATYVRIVQMTDQPVWLGQRIGVP